jgi:uncharacterized protein YaaR (DUF327 family)
MSLKAIAEFGNHLTHKSTPLQIPFFKTLVSPFILQLSSWSWKSTIFLISYYFHWA